MAKKRNHTVFHYLFTVIIVLVKGVIGSILWILIALGGYFIFQSHKTPLDIVLGLPLLLIGGGFSLQALWTVVLAIFSPQFNRGVCRLCQ